MAFSFSQLNKIKISTALFALISVALHVLFLKTPSLSVFSIEKNQEIIKPNKPSQLKVSLKTSVKTPVNPISPIKTNPVGIKSKSITKSKTSSTSIKKENKVNFLSEEITALPITSNPVEIPLIAAESVMTSNEASPLSDLKSEFSLNTPESAELLYDVERIDKSNTRITGNAKLTWKTNASYYSIKLDVQATMLFANLNLYTMQSEGELTHLGLRPRMATEKRLNRAETATHFDSQSNTILFSSSNKRIAMHGVAQDRSSLLLQLASAVKSDASQFTVGRIFSMQVGEDRAAINYVFEVVGTEKIQTKLGQFDALHIVRKPLSGSYQAQLDLWFASELGGYPIQIRNTEGNGNITTQVLAQLKTFPVLEN